VHHVAPSFTLILLVFIGLCAPSRVLGIAAVVLGILVDLQPGPMAVPIIGPAALGYLAGAYVLVQLRSLVFRESVIAFASLVFVVGIAVQLVTVAMYTLRGLPWPLAQPLVGWSASGELVHRFLMLVYTTLLALPIGYVLLRSAAWWGFPGKSRHERRF